MGSNQRPDTLMQDRRRQFDEIFLQRAAGPYIWVKNRPDGPAARLPVYPEQRISRVRAVTSENRQ
ncbi:hypothetical protein V1289_003968 [Bradyrhizobium sp. AZCC 2289]